MSEFSTLSSIIHAGYEILSGPAGQRRDWDRFRSLYIPDGRLMPVIGGEKPRVRVLTVEEYIQRVEPIFAVESFYERETSREEQVIGRMAHVLSQYDSLHDPQGEPFDRGTNSMQLFFDGQRWWFVSVMWNTPRSE
jgi:hypothetical protein